MLWGIDLGGTKIEGAVIDPGDPAHPVARQRIATEQELGYEHVLSRIEGLLTELSRSTGLPRPERVGIGTPGISDPVTGQMRNSNTQCLIGRPLRSDLEARLGCEVLMANDANCFALSEAKAGAARGFDTVFGVILGTGVGGGLVVHGRVLEGLNGIAGEWGHNLLEPDGRDCYCGRKGCVETVISGPALERFYFETAEARRPLHEIAERDVQGIDPYASATIDRLCAMFGQAIAAVINIVDPHVVVVGGGVGNVTRLTTDGARSAYASVFHEAPATPFVKPALGDSSGVVGAALLCSDVSSSPGGLDGH